MLKILPKKSFQEFLKIFTHCTLQVFPLCLNSAPKLTIFFPTIALNILISECSVRVLYYKVTVLLESIDLRSYVQCI